VAPVTPTVRDIPSEVLLDQTDGIGTECAVNCDHVQTVAKGRIGSMLTRLSSDRMREIRAAVNFALALNE
jgi:mRNA interferase MazF